MDYFKSKKSLLQKIKDYRKNKKKHKKDMEFILCSSCKKLTSKEELSKNYYICPECNSYLKMPVDERLNSIFDSYEIIDFKIDNNNPINFPQYKEKLEDTKKNTNLKEAVVVVKGDINGLSTYAFILDSSFLMGSLSRNVGHIIAKTFDLANYESLPVVSFVASGGARMQEGIFSLMQMANTTFALRSHSENKNLYLSIMTNPTTGGVSASFANLGDINIAEPKAMIGFTGPRVIEQTINKKLPEGFQSAEFLLEHGFLDSIVQRENLKDYISKILEYHQR